MRTFKLNRHVDHSGVSGTGIVASGVIFEDGSVALHWPGKDRSTSIFDDIGSVERIHGHNGDTTVEFDEASRGANAEGMVASLQAVTALVSNGMPFTSVDADAYQGRVRLHVDSDNWPAWVAALGGSIDDAIHEPHPGGNYTRHRWMSADASLTCIHLTETETP